MKLYKNYRTALKAANGTPILRIGDTYLVGKLERHTQIELISPDGYINGQIGLGHLERLGNGNWATPQQTQPKSSPLIFPPVCGAA